MNGVKQSNHFFFYMKSHKYCRTLKPTCSPTIEIKFSVTLHCSRADPSTMLFSPDTNAKYFKRIKFDI